MYPSPQAYVEEWRDELLAEGKAEGKAEGAAQAKAAGILTILEKRGIPVADGQRQLLAACTDLALLDRWFDAAIVATSADELFVQ